MRGKTISVRHKIKNTIPKKALGISFGSLATLGILKTGIASPWLGDINYPLDFATGAIVFGTAAYLDSRQKNENIFIRTITGGIVGGITNISLSLFLTPDSPLNMDKLNYYPIDKINDIPNLSNNLLNKFTYTLKMLGKYSVLYFPFVISPIKAIEHKILNINGDGKRNIFKIMLEQYKGVLTFVWKPIPPSVSNNKNILIKSLTNILFWGLLHNMIIFMALPLEMAPFAGPLSALALAITLYWKKEDTPNQLPK